MASEWEEHCVVVTKVLGRSHLLSSERQLCIGEEAIRIIIMSNGPQGGVSFAGRGGGEGGGGR